jgi:hypothetical protein
VSATLSGQGKVGDLNITLNGSTGQSVSLGTLPKAQPMATAFTINRPSLPTGQYGSVTATWDQVSVNIPVFFWVFGNTYFSQYNTVYESKCNNGSATVWLATGKNADGTCSWKQIQLDSKFYQQVNINGTGMSNSYGILKPWVSLLSICPADQPGMLTFTPGNDLTDNVFFNFSTAITPIKTVTGSCNTVLSDATYTTSSINNNNPKTGSVAVYVPPTKTQSQEWTCKDQILLVDSNNNNDSRDLRTAVDICPKCADSTPQNPHIDMYSSSQACSARAVGPYGYFTAIKTKY